MAPLSCRSIRRPPTLELAKRSGPPASAPVTWFAVLVCLSCLSICKSDLRDLNFFHGVVGPVEDRVLSEDEHLDVSTCLVSLGEITAPVWIATKRPKEGKQFVSLRRAPFAEEFKNLSPQIDLILDRI